eukprot:7610222-Alexandrium_andersonii.AAC.1
MDPPFGTRLGTSRTAPFVVRFGINVNSGAERTPRDHQVSMLRPFLGLRSSSFERLKHCCVFGS